jgi:hypothetical protein
METPLGPSCTATAVSSFRSRVLSHTISNSAVAEILPRAATASIELLK